MHASACAKSVLRCRRASLDGAECHRHIDRHWKPSDAMTSATGLQYTANGSGLILRLPGWFHKTNAALAAA